jgi:4-amino-4-deoxy-L-arabinose transferase-like glycosyltransferase
MHPAVLLPEIVAGLPTIVVVYHLVRRSFRTPAGLLAALAITPIGVATDRNNTVDSLKNDILWTIQPKK